MNKKKLTLSLLVIASVMATSLFLLKQIKEPTFNISKDPLIYLEYEFEEEKNPDGGAWYAVQLLKKDNKSFFEGTEAILHSEMNELRLLEADQQEGIIQKYVIGASVYELRREGRWGTTYSMYRNESLLFQRKLKYEADGPIVEGRDVDGRPAFTVLTNCHSQVCKRDVFYDGQFMNKKYNVEDVRNLFSHNEKIGFVAKDDEGKDRIFFDGTFITEPFDVIYTQNCCSIRQIPPLVHENGVLLFHGKRDEKNYLVQVKLEPNERYACFEITNLQKIRTENPDEMGLILAWLVGSTGGSAGISNDLPVIGSHFNIYGDYCLTITDPELSVDEVIKTLESRELITKVK